MAKLSAVLNLPPGEASLYPSRASMHATCSSTLVLETMMVKFSGLCWKSAGVKRWVVCRKKIGGLTEHEVWDCDRRV